MISGQHIFPTAENVNITVIGGGASRKALGKIDL
jgi:hypothetical protein